jgi:alkanesulfonate monooxygenase SsuD/methylene tetrahydromethanopterin reductase-like flavin-dependent oxidoreductase (luciferase family)
VSAPTFGVLHDFRALAPRRTDDVHYAECLAEVELAEKLGYHTVWLPEHHGSADGFLPAPLVMAAAVAARTSTIRVGTNATIAPLHHPIRLAEDAAVVDIVSGGRLTLTFGQGYVEHESMLFGMNPRHRPSALEDAVAVCRQAWTSGRTGFAGRRWQLPDGPFGPLPSAPIPIYLGAYSRPAFDRAARIADGVLIYAGDGGAVDRYRMWTEALDRAGRREHVPVVLGVTVHVAETNRAAWQQAGPAIVALSHGFAVHRLPPGTPPPPPPDPADLDRDACLVGSPELVTDQLVALHRQVPFDQLCLWGRLPGFEHGRAVDAITAFATDVAPAVLDRLRGR